LGSADRGRKFFRPAMRKLEELKLRGRLDGFAGEMSWSVIAEKARCGRRSLR